MTTLLRGKRLRQLFEGWDPELALQPELVGATASGARLPVRVSNTAVRAPGDISTIVYLQDLRAVRALERRVAEAARLEETSILAAGLAHDFNNTLAVVVGNAEMLAEQELPPADQSLIDDILRASLGGQRIAREMLTFSRSMRDTEGGSYDLGEAVAGSAHLVGLLAGQNVQVEWSLTGERLPVGLSAGQLQQILFNLVANARDAMQGSGTVYVRTARAHGSAELTVRDTGPGVPPELNHKIFQPFYTTKPRGVGTGLGLFVIHGLVQGAGGTLQASSHPEGGALFKVELPLVASGEMDIVRLPSSRPPKKPERTRVVLVVEDRDDVRRTMTRALSRAGFDVLQASSGEEAEGVLDGGAEPDLLLTDYSMPGMTGVDLIRRMAERRAVPALLLTGMDLSEDLTSLGTPVEVLTKPIGPRALIKAVTSALVDATD